MIVIRITLQYNRNRIRLHSEWRYS